MKDGESVMGIELKEPHLVARVERLAADRTQLVEYVLETAVQTYLDALEAEAIHAETEAFWAMHANLVEKYLEQHVAVYQGDVVDADTDVRRLEARVREQFGSSPVLIAKVTADPQRDLWWRGGRTEKLRTM